MKRIPQEIWDDISKYLPPVSLMAASTVFGFSLSEEQFNHAKLWSEIFVDERWANLVLPRFGLDIILIGSDLTILSKKSKHESCGTPQRTGRPN